MKLEKCKICNSDYSQKSGHLTIHLKKYHNLSLEDYIVLTEYNNVHPKCQCGFCNDDARFNVRTRKFVKINKEHKKFDWIKEQKLKNGDTPKCSTCGGDVKWKRGKPNKYCSFKCLPNRWNQNKVKETIKEKYGVDNSFKISGVKERIQKTLGPMRKDMAVKCNDTKKLKYKNGAFDPEHLKKTMMKNHGVEHPSQISKNRENASNRMKINNPYFDENGIPKHCRSIKYNDNLYFQSSYEKHFLDLCSDIKIIDKIDNGHSYNYLNDDKDFGYRILTDFSFDDVEIEIKSKWILEKQGGISVVEAKRRAVESSGKKYILILEKDYTEFLSQIIRKK